MDRAVVERYAKGAGTLRNAIAGLSKADLTAFPVPGTWSIQQIVFHMYDSDLIASDRLKRIAAIENPLLIGYDETLFANRLFYQELDASAACAVVEQNRVITYEILRRLPDDAFTRTGIHNERGKITLAEYLAVTCEHLDHHMNFVRKKRELLGKPL